MCGAEAFAEHLSVVAVRLDVSAFALALLLAGAGREELATRRRRFAARIARHRGDVIGANAVICLVALGVGPAIAPLPFRAASCVTPPCGYARRGRRMVRLERQRDTI